MKRMYSRFGIAVASAVILMASIVTAEGKLSNSTLAVDGRVTVERDKEKENLVATFLERSRAKANLPKLQRIRHRADLEQGICTSAFTNQPWKRASAFYITADPGSPATELSKVALTNRMSSNKKPAYSRYSVAVWRVKDQQTGDAAYRVGIGLYQDALGEFVDCHFTDDVYYCGNWKKQIVRFCRGR